MKSFLVFLFLLLGCYGAEYSAELGQRRAALGGDAGAFAPEIDPSGAACSTAAVQAMLEPDRSGQIPGFGKLAIPVEMPAGAKIRICDEDADGVGLHFYDRIKLRLNGSILFAEPATGMFDLIEVHPAATDSKIEDGEIGYLVAGQTLPSADHANVALTINATRFTARDLSIRGAGWGVDLIAETGENHNWPYFSNVTIAGCRRGGIKIGGVDASGGLFLGLKIIACQNSSPGNAGKNVGDDAVCLWEGSANGNGYVGTNLEICDQALHVQPYGGIAASTFVQTYIEEGDLVSWLPSPNGGNYSGNTVTIGGNIMRSSVAERVGGDRFGMKNSKTVFSDVSTAGVRYSVQLPAVDSHSYASFRRNGSPYDLWLLKPSGAIPTAPTQASELGVQHYFSQHIFPMSLRAVTSPPSAELKTLGQPFCGAVDQCGGL